MARKTSKPRTVPLTVPVPTISETSDGPYTLSEDDRAAIRTCHKQVQASIHAIETDIQTKYMQLDTERESRIAPIAFSQALLEGLRITAEAATATEALDWIKPCGLQTQAGAVVRQAMIANGPGMYEYAQCAEFLASACRTALDNAGVSPDAMDTVLIRALSSAHEFAGAFGRSLTAGGNVARTIGLHGAAYQYNE